MSFTKGNVAFWFILRAAGESCRRAIPVYPNFSHSWRSTQILLLLASPGPFLCAKHPSILGNFRIHNYRNLETRKPGQKVPEILGTEKPRCGRKGKGKWGAQERKRKKRWCQVSRALVQFLPVDNILHVLSRGSWLLTQKPCTFLGYGGKCWRGSPWNTCRNRLYVSIYNMSKRLSQTHGWLWEHSISTS